MAKKTRKKYALGGTIDPQGERLWLEYQKGKKDTTIENPNTALAENNIAHDRAMMKAESNPWTQALDMIGNLAIQVGSSMATKGIGSMMGGKAAYGGRVGANVEVEGNEVGELPNGELLDFQGPSHEQGGIDVVLPPGTDIYSDRIKIDNKTLAQRKKKREKLMAKYAKKLKDNPNDSLTKSSLERLKQTTQAEENFDMSLQYAVGSNQQKMATGGTVGIDPVYPISMLPPNEKLLIQLAMGKLPTKSSLLDNSTPEEPEELEEIKVSSLPIKKPNIWNTGVDNKFNTTDVNPLPVKSITPDDVPSNINKSIDYTYSEEPVEKFDPNSESYLTSVLSSLGTTGDIAGIVGNLYQGIKPRQLTKQNRSLDIANPNFMKDFGKEGLKTLENAKDTIKTISENSRNNLKLKANEALKRGRNSASSINTSRALDLATFAGVNNAEGDIAANEASMLLNILGQEAQMKNMRDQAVMMGEQQAFEANTMDRDNFFKQMARDEAALGEAISRTGKATNQIKARNVNEKMLNSLAEFVQIDTKTGKISVKPGVAETDLISQFEKNGGLKRNKIDKKFWKNSTNEQKLAIIKKSK